MESTIIAKIATNSSKASKINQLLSLDFWFGRVDLTNSELILFFALGTVVVIFCLVLIIFFNLISKKTTPPEKKFVSKIIFSTVWFGPLAWLILGFQYLNMPMLSSRFMWVVWTFGLISVGVLLYKAKIKLVASKQSYLSYQLKKKYFPKRKKKK